MYLFIESSLLDIYLLLIMPDKKYWEKVKLRIVIVAGLIINVDVQTYRYANISPVRA
jgi:hypothetical protein